MMSDAAPPRLTTELQQGEVVLRQTSSNGGDEAAFGGVGKLWEMGLPCTYIVVLVLHLGQIRFSFVSPSRINYSYIAHIWNCTKGNIRTGLKIEIYT